LLLYLVVLILVNVVVFVVFVARAPTITVPWKSGDG
jgi:hypothetical protein